MLNEDYECSFEVLLTRSGSFHIHARNLQKLMTEIYKSTDRLSPSLVWEFHEKKHVEYNLRTKTLCKLLTVRTTSFGLQSLSLRGGGGFLWNTLDDSIKKQPTLLAFKNKKTWSGKNAPVGFAANLTLKYIIFILHIIIWFSFSLYCK